MFLHLDGSAVGHAATLDIETLGGIAVGVDTVATARGWWRSRSAAGKVPGAVERSTGG